MGRFGDEFPVFSGFLWVFGVVVGFVFVLPPLTWTFNVWRCWWLPHVCQ